MIPHISDHRWRELVMSTQDPPVKNLSTKMLIMRVRLMVNEGRNDEEKIRQAIELAFEFFSSNELAVKFDIQTIFGAEAK